MNKTIFIDKLNIFLIILSLLIAIKIPFKLFLISYSILGPLHYITEIIWLKDKNYFIKTPNRKWVIVFFIFAILISIFPILKFLDFELPQQFKEKMMEFQKYSNFYLIISFLFAFGLILFSENRKLIFALIIAIIVAFLSYIYLTEFLILIGIFLPTLIHVYLFTLLFIIYGAIKSKSRYGFYTAILLFLVPFILTYVPIDTVYRLSQKTAKTFTDSGMLIVSSKIGEMFNLLQNGKFIALSETGLRIQIFISFAYTYHYLNWFSKTSIIGWKKNISNKKGIAILLFWFLSISLYFYDFKTGLVTLFFLSFLHVLLEFPLNIISIRDIFSFTVNKIKNTRFKVVEKQ